MARKSAKPPREATTGDYPVGYKKPPAGTRFKPGQSGNKKGRPKKVAKDPYEQIADALQRMLKVRLDGEDQWMTADEAIGTRLVELAVKGDLKAIRLLFDYRQRYADLMRERSETPMHGVLIVPGSFDPDEWELNTLLELKKHPIMGPPDEAKIKELQEKVRKAKELKDP